MKRAFEQLACLGYELGLIVNRKPWRIFTIWLGGSAGIIVSYRLDRFFYLAVGKPWVMLRALFFPFWLALRVLSGAHQIHYRANIGKGLRILHSVLGIVISGHAVIGKNLILTGGNCIGGKDALRPGDLVVGDNVVLGANAVIIGPVKVGSNVTIGAGAVVIKDALDGSVLVGVPARDVNHA